MPAVGQSCRASLDVCLASRDKTDFSAKRISFYGEESALLNRGLVIEGRAARTVRRLAADLHGELVVALEARLRTIAELQMRDLAQIAVLRLCDDRCAAKCDLSGRS